MRKRTRLARRLGLVLAALLFAAAALALRVQYQLGRFAELGTPTPWPVLPIRDEVGLPLPSAAELAVDHLARRVYLPFFGERAGGAGREPVGRLYELSLDDPTLRARDVTPRMPRGFRPHGMDLLQQNGSGASLYVVNVGADTIEIFDLAPDGGLSHRETVSDLSFVGLNAVTVVGARRFYLTTNEAGPWGKKLEAMLHAPRTRIIYFDGKAARPVITGLNHCSGLVASRDGAEIYVAEGFSRRLRVYARDPQNGSLKHERDIPLHTAPDDLEIATDGSVWAGTHPRPYALFAFASDRGLPPPPSRVVRVDLALADAQAAQVVFEDDGTRVNSSSSATRVDNLLLIASVFGSPSLVRLPSETHVP